jgi:type II secretory ATPase GspE/PulE/Tfp pilus assembly ATPase PilB-like protein
MVGEIRDRETATTAIQAAITGHLVLSSIHANDAISILLRLMSMCDDPTLFPPTIIGVVAQRMIRKVCSNCRTTYEPTAAELAVFQEETKQTPSVLYKGTGCNICAHTGYRGRTGLFEILPISDESREMLLSNASAGEIKKQAIKEGMVTMRHDGLLKAIQGITTLNEVQRSIYSITIDNQNNLKRQYGVLV